MASYADAVRKQSNIQTIIVLKLLPTHIVKSVSYFVSHYESN